MAEDFVNKKGLHSRPHKLRDYLAGLEDLVTDSNHTGWPDHKFLAGKVMAGSQVPGLQLP